MKRILIALALSAAVAVTVYSLREMFVPLLFAPNAPQAPSSANQAASEPASQPSEAGTSALEAIEPVMEVLATGLRVPWEVAELPAGDLLVTERGGQLTKISSDGTKQSYVVSGTAEVGEGGLLGMALAPDFETSRFVYLYQTVRHPNGRVANRVVRAVFQGGLGEPQVVIDEIPGAKYHDGGRIAFGPDGMLYITTGDASESSQAQDTASLAGKILRLNPDGSVPSDNPFGNAVWSYGHRNPQGLAWDDQGRLWATEHGRSGISTGYDELNLIVKGGNYGWPDLQGDAKREGMIPPVAHSGPKVTWAPAGIAFYDGALYFAGLRGAALYRAVPDESGKVDGVTPFLQKEYGRLRAVHTIGNYLYVTTSNRDGRGSARDWDDQLLRFRAGALK